MSLPDKDYFSDCPLIKWVFIGGGCHVATLRERLTMGHNGGLCLDNATPPVTSFVDLQKE